MTERTTIEITEEVRDRLQKERLDHESSYNDTMERLLDMQESPYVTEQEVRDIVGEMVVLEALD